MSTSLVDDVEPYDQLIGSKKGNRDSECGIGQTNGEGEDPAHGSVSFKMTLYRAVAVVWS